MSERENFYYIIILSCRYRFFSKINIDRSIHRFSVGQCIDFWQILESRHVAYHSGSVLGLNMNPAIFFSKIDIDIIDFWQILESRHVAYHSGLLLGPELESRQCFFENRYRASYISIFGRSIYSIFLSPIRYFLFLLNSALWGIVGPSRLEPPRVGNLTYVSVLFFFSFDLKSSSESNGHGLEFLKFQERVELEYEIIVFPQEKRLAPLSRPCRTDSEKNLFVIATKRI